jgi:hypothetical protein
MLRVAALIFAVSLASSALADNEEGRRAAVKLALCRANPGGLIGLSERDLLDRCGLGRTLRTTATKYGTSRQIIYDRYGPAVPVLLVTLDGVRVSAATVLE